MKELILMICFLLFISTRAISTNTEAEHKVLDEAQCRPIEMLVELPIPEETFYKLSATHAYVRRCLGVNDEKKACVSIDPKVKTEHWNVVKTSSSANKEFIHVSWVSHEKCKYQRRKKNNCPVDMAKKCRKQSTTHYYDEINCTCSCIVQIDGKDTCLDKTIVVSASGIMTWLPILTFASGIAIAVAFLYFKKCQEKKMDLKNNFNDPDNEGTPVIGFSDVEQPAEPPTPPAAIEQTDKNKIGFIH